MWPVKTILFFVGFVAACALSLAFPIVGIVNYMIIYLVNPDKTWWGNALSPLGIRYSLTAAICLILGMIISSGRVPRNRSLIGGWEGLVILFALVVASSAVVGMGSSEYGIVLLDKIIKVTVFIICLTTMASTRRNFMVVLWTLVVGSLIIGYDAFHAPTTDFADGRLNFVGGPDFRESSGLAVHMASMLPLIGVAALLAHGWRWRLLALAAGVLTVNTVIQCRTRSALIGLVACAAVAALLVPRTRQWRIYLLLGVASIGGFWLADDRFWTRMSTVIDPAEYTGDTTIHGRLELWRIATQMTADHPLGVGVGQFKYVIVNYNPGVEQQEFPLRWRVTHNSYLLCVTELGIQGLMVLLLIMLVAFLKASRCFKLAGLTDDPRATRLLAYGCTLAMVTYLVSAAFTDRLYTESFWWVLALPICLERAVLREAAARQFEFAPALSPEFPHEFADGLPASTGAGRAPRLALD